MESTPPGDALPPPPQRATPTRKGSRCGAGAEIPRPHRPHPGHAGRGTLAARSRGRAARGRRPRNPKPSRGEPGPDRPPPARQTEHGTGAGHAEGHGPSGTALPAPSAGTTRDARATPPSGGGSGHRESASAHTRKGHAGTTGRATGPSARNAQTAWNGVPASEGKGHPEGTARHTQRGTRGAGRGKQERHNTRYRPEPPPNRPRAPRTHRRDTAPAKAVVAHSATPQPLG